MLAQLDEIEGVEFSSSNRSGALVKLSLKPGADPAKVAEGAQRVLTAQVADRVPVPLGGRVAAAAVQGQEWWDHSQVAELVATGIPPSVRQSPTALPVLLLWWLVVALGLCWWQRRRMLAVARRRGLLA